MKKIIAIVLAVSSLFFLTVSKTLADWSVGVAGTLGVYEATGSEILSGGKTSTAVEHAKFGFPQIFLEYDTGSVSIGLEMIPGKVKTTTTSRTDYNTSEPDGSNICTGNDFCGTSGTNSVKVEISHHVGLYGLIPIMDTGVFLKAGLSRMDVATQEDLATGSTYGDLDGVSGGHVSLGYQHDTDAAFIRLEVGYSDYESMDITGTGGHRVDADIEGGWGRLSIGKSF